MTVEVSAKDAPDATADTIFLTTLYCSSCHLIIGYGQRFTKKFMMSKGIKEGEQFPIKDADAELV